MCQGQREKAAFFLASGRLAYSHSVVPTLLGKSSTKYRARRSETKRSGLSVISVKAVKTFQGRLQTPSTNFRAGIAPIREWLNAPA